MFDEKLQNLFSSNSPVKKVEYTTSGNGALKLTSTGDPFVDQFGLISQYRQLRPYSSISKDMQELWDIDPMYALKLLFYIRLITRKVKFHNGTETSKVQKGAGLRHEAFMRMLWLAVNHSETFYKNLPLFITIGSWKDIIQLMSYDLQYHGWNNKVLDFDKMSDFILAGLENPNTCNLVKKFLPAIKARSTTLESQANTIIGKFLAHKLFGDGEFSPKLHSNNSYCLYRKLKSSGTAHEWQQMISRSQFNIDFSKVHGRALALLVSGNYLRNHNLEKDYEEWIKKQPVAKFTGFVYELFKGLKSNSPLYKKYTIDKQFENLIQTAKEGSSTESSFIVARDVSGSMSSNVKGLTISSNDVAKSMALYFSYLLKGKFANSYIEFSHKPILKYWEGDSPTDKYLKNINYCFGDTNFLGIADLFIEIYKHTSIEKFPTGLICISDGEFNDSGDNKTNFQSFKKRLLKAGFPKDYVDNFKIVLWDIPNAFYSNEEIRPKFESYADTPNFFYMGGLDPAGITFLLGGEVNKSIPKTPRELFETAMNQEIMDYIQM